MYSPMFNKIKSKNQLERKKERKNRKHIKYFTAPT